MGFKFDKRYNMVFMCVFVAALFLWTNLWCNAFEITATIMHVSNTGKYFFPSRFSHDMI